MSEFGGLRKHENTAHREKTHPQNTWVVPYIGDREVAGSSLGQAGTFSPPSPSPPPSLVSGWRAEGLVLPMRWKTGPMCCRRVHVKDHTTAEKCFLGKYENKLLGWVARLCRRWLFPVKPDGISHGKISHLVIKSAKYKHIIKLHNAA